MADPTAIGSPLPAAPQASPAISNAAEGATGQTAQPAAQVESIDLTTLGFQGKSLPKPFLEKITGYKPEHLEYLEKLDPEDRQAYDTSRENWNIKQNAINRDLAKNRDSFTAKLSELDDREQKLQERYQELEQSGANSVYFQLNPAERKAIDEYQKWLKDGEIDQGKFDKMTTPIIEAKRRELQIQRDFEGKQAEEREKQIESISEKVLTAKWGLDSKRAAHLSSAFVALENMSPEDAVREMDSTLNSIYEMGVQAGAKKAIENKLDKPAPTETENQTKPPAPASTGEQEIERKKNLGLALFGRLGR